MHASVGDRIVVRTETLGAPQREGTVREILGTPGSEHYRVSWDDGHESVLSPGPDARVLPAGTGIPRQPQAPDAAATRPAGPHDPVERIMSSPVATVDGHDSLRVAAETLSAANIGALIVTSEDSDTPLGIISERDVVRALAAGGDPDEVWAADVVGLDTVWATPTDSTFDVARLMRDAEVRHMPIRSGERCVGMVSIRDVLKILIGS
jgi:CBS domain-containing protein